MQVITLLKIHLRIKKTKQNMRNNVSGGELHIQTAQCIVILKYYTIVEKPARPRQSQPARQPFG